MEGLAHLFVLLALPPVFPPFMYFSRWDQSTIRYMYTHLYIETLGFPASERESTFCMLYKNDSVVLAQSWPRKRALNIRKERKKSALSIIPTSMAL